VERSWDRKDMERNLILVFVFVKTVEFQLRRGIHRRRNLKLVGEEMKRRDSHTLKVEEKKRDLEDEAEVFLVQTRNCQAELGNSS
jgi:hypothetical protein